MSVKGIFCLLKFLPVLTRFFFLRKKTTWYSFSAVTHNTLPCPVTHLRWGSPRRKRPAGCRGHKGSALVQPSWGLRKEQATRNKPCSTRRKGIRHGSLSRARSIKSPRVLPSILRVLAMFNINGRSWVPSAKRLLKIVYLIILLQAFQLNWTSIITTAKWQH